jgi:glutamate 5-kinase
MTQNIERLVVKVGTGFLFDKRDDNTCILRPHQIAGLAEEIAKISESKDIALVSSGAIATASWKYNMPVPEDHYERARLSGIGQPILMGLYMQEFEKHGKRVAQFLICGDDLDPAKSRPESRRSLRKNQETYFKDKVMGVYNENDLISIEEITFGDNDILAALLACSLDADLLVMLSDPKEGLGTGGRDSKDEARKIVEKENIKLEMINGAYELTEAGIYKPKIQEIAGIN